MKIYIIKILAKILPKKLYLKFMHYIRIGKKLSFKNPETFNEKMQWRKIYAYKPIHTIISDKYEVRKYIAEKVGEKYLIPLIGVYKECKDVIIKELPNQFVLKTNHGSGGVIIVKDKSRWEYNKDLKSLNKTLKENYYYFSKEPQYIDIKPMILAESLLVSDSGELAYDYKFHCFNGKIEFIQVDISKFSNHTRVYYDSDWNRLPFNFCPGTRSKPIYPLGPDIEEPELFEEMKIVTKELAKEFDYIRVDLYCCNKKIYFGELTLHPGGGWARFYPEKYDLVYGKLLKNNL